MKVVSMTHRESLYGTYVSPEVNVVAYWSQGVLCQSVGGGNQDFTYDDAEDL
jgi:hypothetical protein